jgi:hypothetical protein
VGTKKVQKEEIVEVIKEVKEEKKVEKEKAVAEGKVDPVEDACAATDDDEDPTGEGELPSVSEVIADVNAAAALPDAAAKEAVTAPEVVANVDADDSVIPESADMNTPAKEDTDAAKSTSEKVDEKVKEMEAEDAGADAGEAASEEAATEVAATEPAAE